MTTHARARTHTRSHPSLPPATRPTRTHLDSVVHVQQVVRRDAPRLHLARLRERKPQSFPSGLGAWVVCTTRGSAGRGVTRAGHCTGRGAPPAPPRHQACHAAAAPSAHPCCRAGCAGLSVRGTCPLLPPTSRGHTLRAASEACLKASRRAATTHCCCCWRAGRREGGSAAPPSVNHRAHPCCAAAPAWRKRAPPSTQGPGGWLLRRWACCGPACQRAAARGASARRARHAGSTTPPPLPATRTHLQGGHRRFWRPNHRVLARHVSHVWAAGRRPLQAESRQQHHHTKAAEILRAGGRGGR